MFTFKITCFDRILIQSCMWTRLSHVQCEICERIQPMCMAFYVEQTNCNVEIKTIKV